MEKGAQVSRQMIGKKLRYFHLQSNFRLISRIKLFNHQSQSILPFNFNIQAKLYHGIKVKRTKKSRMTGRRWLPQGRFLSYLFANWN